MVRPQAFLALAISAMVAVSAAAHAQTVNSLVFLPRVEDGGYVDALRREARANGYLMSVAASDGDLDVDARIARATELVSELDARVVVFLSDRAVWMISDRGTVRHAPLGASRAPISPRMLSLIVVGLIDEVEQFEAEPPREGTPTIAASEPSIATDESSTGSVTESSDERRTEAAPETDEPSIASPPGSTELAAPSGSPETQASVEAPPVSAPASDLEMHGPVTAVVVEPAYHPDDEPDLEVVFGFDLVPFVGTSTLSHGRARRNASFNLLVGFDHSIHGFELGGLANLERRHVRGVQIAGLLNAHGGDLHGVQLSGGANATWGVATGAQIATVNFAREGLVGAQVGVLNLTTGTTHGLQLGAANVAFGDTRGLQLGAVNVASGDTRGVQIGLVNVGRRTRFAFGLLNIVRDGRTHVDVLGSDSGILYAQVKHGGDHFHTILSVGVDPFATHPAALLGFGYGVRATPARRFFLDVDFLGHFLVDSQLDSQDDLEQLVSARLLGGVRLHERFALVFGPSYEVLISNRDSRTGGLRTYKDTVLSDGGTTGVRAFGWPGLIVGLEML